jgi:hypothetical protein
MKCMSCGKEYKLSLCPDCARASYEDIGKKRKALGTKRKKPRKRDLKAKNNDTKQTGSTE